MKPSCRLFSSIFLEGLLLASLIFPATWLAMIGLIWMAHIGFDRMMGYGLKYESGFKDTHLQRL